MSPMPVRGSGGCIPTGIGHLLDHTCRIWRPSRSLGAARQEVVCHAVAEASLPCAANRKRSVLALQQGGLGDSGQRMVYLDLGANVEERDVVELLTGPNAPALLEVISKDTPRGHHIELTCDEWEGKITECS